MAALAGPAEGTLRDMIIDGEKLRLRQTEATYRFVKTSCNERASFLDSLLTIGVTLLIGAMTFYTVAPQFVKTPVLFFVGAACLLICIVMSLAARVEIIRHLQAITYQLEKQSTKVASAARLFRNSADEDNMRAMAAAEVEQIQLDRLKWTGVFGHAYATIFLLLGLLSLSVALLLRITLK
ncbi:MAG TPA: hypothetical protein VLG40_04565 [Candidatus Saccharimonas sp.]|nr:hypothetical protein [Candidatus Saccharimonas sp.]